jgi:hypothetical protein
MRRNGRSIDRRGHKRRRVGIALLVALAAPASASGAIRSVSATYPSPTPPPAITPQPNPAESEPYLSSSTVSYDEAGALTVAVAFHYPAIWREAGAISYSLRSKCDGDGPSEVLYGDARFKYDKPDAILNREGYAGTLVGAVTITDAGYSVTFSAPGIAGIDLRCVYVDAQRGVGHGIDYRYFDGYAPPPPPTPVARIPLTDDNAVDFFEKAMLARFPEVPPDAYFTCPGAAMYDDEEWGGTVAPCVARWLLDGGEWAHASAAMIEGETGPELRKGLYVRRWVREWTREPASCLRRVRVKGRVWTNFDACPNLMVSDLDYLRRKRKPIRSAHEHGTNTAGLQRFTRYTCKRWGRGYECRNKAGDAFRWVP